MQIERTGLLNVNPKNETNHYLTKTIFGLGCLAGVGCTAVQALSITNIDFKSSKWLLLAGTVGFVGISIFGVAFISEVEKKEAEEQLKAKEITDALSSLHQSEIKEISQKVKDILSILPINSDCPDIDSNSGLICFDNNKTLPQLEFIHEFLRGKQDSKEITITEKIFENLADNEELNKVKQELEDAKEELEQLNDMIDSLKLKCAFMSNGVHKVSLFLGSQGGLTLDQLNSARTHVASLSKEYSTESDSSASASASTSVTSSPFKGQGRPYKGNIPRLNLDGNG